MLSLADRRRQYYHWKFGADIIRMEEEKVAAMGDPVRACAQLARVE